MKGFEESLAVYEAHTHFGQVSTGFVNHHEIGRSTTAIDTQAEIGTKEPLFIGKNLTDESLTEIFPKEFPELEEATGKEPSVGSYYGENFDGQVLPPPSEWSHRPIFITSSKSTTVSSNIHPSVPFEFESEVFAGTAIIRIARGASDDSEEHREEYNHRFQVAIQGRFKEPINVSDVSTGQEFEKNLKYLPPWWIVNAGTAIVRQLSPSVEMDFYSDRPRMLANLAMTAKELRADEPGSEPPIENLVFEENSFLLMGNAQREITATMRKKHLTNPLNSAQLQYDTETIYTFNFYQDMLDLETFSVDLGFTKLSIIDSLNGQPIQVLAKTKDGRYLWSFQIWHENLLVDDTVEQESQT